MDNKSSNYPDYDISESTEKKDKSMNCKDGFCFIPSSESNKTINNENINIFDPLQIKNIIKELYLSDSIDHFTPNKVFNFLRINQTNSKKMHSDDYTQKV